MRYTILFLLLPLAAQASWKEIDYREFSLVPPPAIGSAEVSGELQTLHHWQRERSWNHCAQALRQIYPSFGAFFGDASILSRHEIRKSRALLEKVSKLAMDISSDWKDVFDRPRPFLSDRSINPCAYVPAQSGSYPSGHATVATADACILAHIFPNKREAILRAGREFSYLRVITGVHYPSDVKAGEVLGEDLCENLLARPDFRRLAESIK